jgi:signal transduction histidine kinase
VGDRGASRDPLVQAGLVLASELSLPAVLQKLANLACDVADARYGALGVLGPDGQIHEFVTHGVTEDERRAIGHIPVGKGILGVLISDAHPLRLRRIQDDTRSVGFPAHHPPMTSFLGVPIKIHGRVYGNLYLTEKRGAAEFTADDEAAVVTLATQAAVAIENARLYQEARLRQRRLEAAAEVIHSILGGRPLDEVLSLVARRARELASADLATIATPDDGELVLRVAEGEPAGRLLGMRFSADRSISGRVMGTREPLILEDASKDDRVHQPVVRAGDIGPALFVPLAAGDRVFGTLAVANLRGGRRFTEEDLGVVRPFADQAAVALDYARIRKELERLAVLEDRERIAKELHDGVIQSLFAVGMGLQATESVAGEPEITRRLTAAVEDIDRVVRDLRNYIFGLGPGGPADRQLDQALRDLVEEFRRGSDVAMRVEIDPQAASLLAPHAANALQLAREAMSNAVRHAGAQTLALELLRDGNTVLLQVEDDGAGFNAEEASSGGRGLTNLRARAEAIGGQLEISSAPGRGTVVRLSLPA